MSAKKGRSEILTEEDAFIAQLKKNRKAIFN